MIERDLPRWRERFGHDVECSLSISEAYVRTRYGRDGLPIKRATAPTRYTVNIHTIGVWQGDSLWVLT